MAAFKRAERKAAKLRAAICGTSGSGKTYSALLLARGLGNRIAVIDTERGSAELYSDLFDYDVAQLEPPYTPKRFIALINEAARHYDVLIIDSLSHAWSGEGGVLAMHDNAARADKAGNSYTAWRNVTPEHNALVEAVLGAPCHVICSMRSKTAYEMTTDDRGKKKPIKIGLAPIQRDGMEYEFTLVFDVSVDGHIATASKDRTRLWESRNEVITESHGRELKAWLESGKDVQEVIQPPAATSAPPPVTVRDFDEEIAEITDPAEIRPWLIYTAQSYGWTKTDQVYLALKAACAEHAEHLHNQANPVTTQSADDFEADLGPVEDLS